jgi:DNA mismatch repair ATPase MutS
VQGRRLALKPKAPDKSYLFAEMQRQEIRTWLRSLPDAERTRAALQADEQVASAILNAPPALSGINLEIHAHVAEKELERKFGPQLREIEEREEWVGKVNAAIEVATMQFRRESGLTEKDV